MFQIYRKYKETYDIGFLKKRQMTENKKKKLRIRCGTENVHEDTLEELQRGESPPGAHTAAGGDFAAV